MTWVTGLTGAVCVALLFYVAINGAWHYGRADGIRWATRQVYGEVAK